MTVLVEFQESCVIIHVEPRGAAYRKSGVASHCLRTFRCGMGGSKLENCVDVCAYEKGVIQSERFTHNMGSQLGKN